MELHHILTQYDFNLAYAGALLSDVTDMQMTHVPCIGLENHAAFTIGHLAAGSASLAEDLGGVFELPDGWAELFVRKGPGDPRRPDGDVSLYPSKEKLLNELERQHDEVKRLLQLATSEQLSSKIKWCFGERMPELLDVVIFFCIGHEAMHLGQLAGWRRAMGLPSALAAI